MAKKPARTLTVGSNGEVTLPADVLRLLDVAPGDAVELRLDTRGHAVRLERHVEDAWAEALKPKPQKGLEDVLDEQSRREREADDLFERRLREKRSGGDS